MANKSHLDLQVINNNNETKMFLPRREEYEEEVRYRNCLNYRQCSVCYKCINKAAHLYKECETCNVPRCMHKEADRALLIKPENFLINGGGLEDKIVYEYHKYELSKIIGLALTDGDFNGMIEIHGADIRTVKNHYVINESEE